jgi:hypothetical protein
VADAARCTVDPVDEPSAGEETYLPTPDEVLVEVDDEPTVIYRVSWKTLPLLSHALVTTRCEPLPTLM